MDGRRAGTGVGSPVAGAQRAVLAARPTRRVRADVSFGLCDVTIAHRSRTLRRADDRRRAPPAAPLRLECRRRLPESRRGRLVAHRERGARARRRRVAVPRGRRACARRARGDRRRGPDLPRRSAAPGGDAHRADDRHRRRAPRRGHRDAPVQGRRHERARARRRAAAAERRHRRATSASRFEPVVTYAKSWDPRKPAP